MMAARALVLAMLVFAPMVTAAQGPPADLEVRTTKDSITNDTLTTLTLMLAGPNGPLPINMAITSVHKAKAGAGAVAYRLEFDMPLYTGALDYKAPQVVFDLGGGQRLSFDVDSRATPPAVTHISASPFSAGELSRMARAATIRGQLFGVEFVLTPAQVRAVKDFAQRR